MNNRLKNGFTLIELIIATAILISVFSVIGLTVQRLVKMRQAAEERAYVYAQAMTTLDAIEEDVRNFCSTNAELAMLCNTFYRTIAIPRGTAPGEAHTNMAYCTVAYENGAPADEEIESVARRRIGTWTPQESTSPTNYASRTVYTLDENGRISVTNAVGGSGDVFIAGASAGDTITVPVVSGTAKRITDIRSTYSGWTEIPDPPAETNEERAVSTGVTFTNSFSSSVVKIVKRPLTGTWPEPGTNFWTLTQLAEFTSECASPESFSASPIYLDDSAHFATTNLAVYSTPATNSAPSSTTITSNLLFSAFLAITNSIPATSEAALGYYHTSTTPIPGFWTYGTKPPPGIPSSAEVTNPGLSNILNVVTNVAGGTYDYREYDAYSRNAYWVSEFAALASQALPLSTNESLNAILSSELKDFAAGKSFYNDYYPHANGIKVPLAITQSESLSPSIAVTDGGLVPVYGSSLRTTAIGSDTNILLTSASGAFKTTVSVLCEVTATNLILTSGIAYSSETTYTAESTFPPSIDLPSGRFHSSGEVTNKNSISYSEDTDWKDLTLDEDFAGGTETITGLWLEEDTVDDSKLRAFDEFLSHHEASSPQSTWGKFKALAESGSYAEASVIFYTFGDGDETVDKQNGDPAGVEERDYEKRLELIPLDDEWESDDMHAATEKLRGRIPDCADIFLEIHPRTASGGALRSEIYNFFYRRVPLKTKNLWSPP